MVRKFVGKILPNIMELIKGDMVEKQDKMDILDKNDMKNIWDNITQPPISQIKVMITDENNNPTKNAPIVLKIRDDMGNDGDTIADGTTDENGMITLKDNINTNTRYNLYINNSSSPVVIKTPNEVLSTSININGDSINIENGKIIDNNIKFNGVLIKWPTTITGDYCFDTVGITEVGKPSSFGYHPRMVSNYPNGFLCENRSYNIAGVPNQYEVIVYFSSPSKKLYQEEFTITEEMIENSIENGGIIEFRFTE